MSRREPVATIERRKAAFLSDYRRICEKHGLFIAITLDDAAVELQDDVTIIVARLKDVPGGLDEEIEVLLATDVYS